MGRFAGTTQSPPLDTAGDELRGGTSMLLGRAGTVGW